MCIRDRPSTFHVQAYGQAAIIARSVAMAPSPARAPIRRGGVAVVGVSTTSKRSKTSPTRRRRAVSARREARRASPPRTRPVRTASCVRGSSSAGSGTRATQSRTPLVARGTKVRPIGP